MTGSNAAVVDILRCSQKDEQFLDLYNNQLTHIIRLCGNKVRNFSQYTHSIAQSLYYYLTSLSNYQTIGEEYTGIIRYNQNKNNIPNKWNQLLWLLLFVGGDHLYYNCLRKIEKKIKSNKNLTPHARATILKWIQFIIHNKDLIIRLNQTIFYMNGKYYNISNRLTGIQYLVLRHWMKDDSSIETFNLLGQVSMLYLICTILHKLYDNSNQQLHEDVINEISQDVSYRMEECFLCTEMKQKPSMLPCGHVFCWNCINNTIAHGPKCPICREVIQTNRIILLQNY